MCIRDSPHALVLERIWGVPLALKPNFESLLRCRWTPGQTFTAAFVWNVAKSVANALSYLHKHNICHGDVYGHNVLADEEGNSVLCDYGKHMLRFCMLCCMHGVNKFIYTRFTMLPHPCCLGLSHHGRATCVHWFAPAWVQSDHTLLPIVRYVVLNRASWWDKLVKRCMISANCLETCVESCMALQVHLSSTKQEVCHMRLKRYVHTGCCCMTLFPGSSKRLSSVTKTQPGSFKKLSSSALATQLLQLSGPPSICYTTSWHDPSPFAVGVYWWTNGDRSA